MTVKKYLPLTLTHKPDEEAAGVLAVKSTANSTRGALRFQPQQPWWKVIAQDTDAADLNKTAGRKSSNLTEGPIVVIPLWKENVRLLA